MTRTSTTLDPIDIGEVDVVTFDFASRLGNETIITATTEVVLMYGVDPTPGNFKIGSPQVSGAFVNQKVGNAVLNSHYDLRCTAVTATRELVESCIMKGVEL